MKANEYKLMDRCVEDGILCGFARAHKHAEKPTPEQLRDYIHQAVMLEISEWFEFDEIKEETA